MSKSYTPVMSDYKFVAIIEHLLINGKSTGTAIAKALDMPYGTVMSHLTVALDVKWARQYGELYAPGIRIPGMYSVFKMSLQEEVETNQRELQLLEA